MIDGLKPYSAYKESGVLWLRQIPTQWDHRMCGFYCSFSSGTSAITRASAFPDDACWICAEIGEVGNAHDPRAIRLDIHDMHVGYVPQDHNTIIAALRALGATFERSIVGDHAGQRSRGRLSRQNFGSPGCGPLAQLRHTIQYAHQRFSAGNIRTRGIGDMIALALFRRQRCIGPAVQLDPFNIVFTGGSV